MLRVLNTDCCFDLSSQSFKTINLIDKLSLTFIAFHLFCHLVRYLGTYLPIGLIDFLLGGGFLTVSDVWLSIY